MSRKHLESDHATHPGSLLGEELEERGISSAELARTIGCSTEVIGDIIGRRRDVTAETASELERALGIPATLWMNLQRRHDAVLARRKQSA